jgi:hypothetical protein
MVLWYSVFWLRAAIVYTWSGDFNRRCNSSVSTRANKFAPPVASSIARAMLHSISIFNNKPPRSPRSPREAKNKVLWSCGLLVKSCIALVLWYFGILVFWLRAAIVYTWSGDFNRRSTNLFSKNLRDLRERQEFLLVLWFSGILVLWLWAANVESSTTGAAILIPVAVVCLVLGRINSPLHG